jgi:hypothetical protein
MRSKRVTANSPEAERAERLRKDPLRKLVSEVKRELKAGLRTRLTRHRGFESKRQAGFELR